MHIDEICRTAAVDVSLAGAVILGMEVKEWLCAFPACIMLSNVVDMGRLFLNFIRRTPTDAENSG